MGLLCNPASPAFSRRHAPFLLLLVALLVSGTVANLFFSVPFGHTLSWTQLLGMLAKQVFVVSLISAVTVSALSPVFLGKDTSPFLRVVRQASICALWLAPLALFLQEHSFWTMPVVAALTVMVAGSFETADAISDSVPEPLLISLREDTLPLVPGFALQRSFLAACCLQVGALLGLRGNTAIAALMVAFSVTLWAWAFHHAGGMATTSTSSPSLTFLVVALLMLVGLMPHLQHAFGSGAASAHRGLFRSHPSGGSSKQPPAYAAASIQGHLSGSEGDQGIILWGEKQNYTKLVAPMPVVTNALNANGNANPLVIPFDGVYWFFKSPDLRPPVGSRQAHTTPDLVEIRSTDRRPLSIEAHDHLANLIDLDCCSRIQIAIRNADRYPETVSLELVLVNTALPHSPSVSLGRMWVNSTRPWNLYEKPEPVNETLSFTIPIRRTLRRFDDIKIVFFLDQARADAAARIAIDHFVLIPRGL